MFVLSLNCIGAAAVIHIHKHINRSQTNEPKILWFIKSIIRRAFGSRTCFSILLLKFSWLDFSLFRASSSFVFFYHFCYISLTRYCRSSCVFISEWFFCGRFVSLVFSLFHSFLPALWIWSAFRSCFCHQQCLVDWCWCCSATVFQLPVIDYSVISEAMHTIPFSLGLSLFRCVHDRLASLHFIFCVLLIS